MSRKFLTAVDLAKNELQNAAVQSLAAAPSTPVKFQLYGNSSDNTLYWWDGTAWIPAKSAGGAFPGYGSVPAETTFGIARADGVSTLVARSDHTHGSPTHDNAAHGAINLSALAVPIATVNMNSQLVSNVATPVAATDAANKGYVDNAVAGLSWKDPVRAATTANITLSGAQTIDGVSVIANDRVLVMNQSTASGNGIYVAAAGAWARATDADVAAEIEGLAVFVMEGTANGNKSYVCTTDAPITVGTTSLTFAQFAGSGMVAGGAGLVLTGNTLDVVAGDTTLTVAADSVAVNTSVIATVASLAGYTPTARTLTAGSGLTGGGDLSANRSFDVGAGTGISVAADTVALDTAYTDGRYATVANSAKRFAAACAAATSTVVNHALNTRDVVVDVYRTTTPWDSVEADVERTDVNNVTVRFTTAPAAGDYRIVVVA